MAKNDNLGDYLADIADAIRAKKGTADPINAQDFASEISGIETGSTVAASPYLDVNFVDIDGTILHSFSKEQFLSMDSLPEEPSRYGLVCQGWNHTYEEAHSYVEKYGSLMVGATYMTDDGATRLYIRVFSEGRKNVPLFFNQSVSQGVSIDWGDGSPLEVLEETGYVNTSHEYERLGDYVIRLVVSEGTMSFGSGDSANSILGATTNSNRAYRTMLTKVEIGEGVTNLGAYAFEYCFALEMCSIPKGVTGVGTYVFGYCISLKHVTFPKGFTGYSTYTLRDCSGLSTVSLPQGAASFSTGVFYYCTGLSHINIPETAKSLGVYFLQYCSALGSLTVPSSITSFGAFAFAACYSTGIYDFTAYASVPSLGNANVFNNIPADCKIIVREELLDSWKAATNWSTYADRIVSISN